VTRAVPSAPSIWFTDPQFLARERAAVFAPHWHYVGSAADVAEPGSFMATDLGGLPIVVTRDGEGRLRALANVCRHRGHVVADGCGRRKTLQCRYHGWTYLLDGTLHRAPGAEVDPDDGRLPELAVAAVGSLLFACVDRDAAPLVDLLAPFLDLTRDVSQVDIDRLVRRRSVPHQLEANWKVVAENFMECYHCPLVHGDTLPAGYGGGDGDYVITTYDSLVTHRLDSDRFSWANLFPNTQISVFGHYQALAARQIVPDGVGRTQALIDYWFDPDVPEQGVTDFVDWFEKVVAEDIPLCNNVQIGNASGLLEHGMLHPSEESGPIWFERLIAEALGEVLV
jgi:choline monooxygenase